MSKTIQVKLSAKSINEAIKELQVRKSWVEQKSAELTEKLAFLGATVTSLNYARAIFDGNKDFTVNVVKNEKGYSVHCQGTCVAFIEFGTGVYAFSGQIGTQGVGESYNNYPGVWSQDHKQQFSTKGYWYHGGNRHIGSTPGNGMQDASKQVEQEIRRVFKEVFSQ